MVFLVLGVLIASHWVNGIHYEDSADVIIVVIVLATLNVFLRPILVLFALPFVLLTLGLGMLVINALLFEFADWLVPGFHVDGFWAAFWGAFWVSVTSFLGNLFIQKPKVEVHTYHGSGGRKRREQIHRKDDDDVIDV